MKCRPPAEELGAVALVNLRSQKILHHQRGGKFERCGDELTLKVLSKEGNR